MEDVIQLDLLKYNITLKGHSVDYPAKLPGVTEECFTYILESEQSVLDILCIFMNDKLYLFLLSKRRFASIHSAI